MNVHGLPGMNIPADLLQEHLNHVCKDAVFGPGANKTEKSIGRAGKALGILSTVLNQYDHAIGIPDYSGTHKNLLQIKTGMQY